MSIDFTKQIGIDAVHNVMLDGISEEYQKTEGFPTYDLTRGMAFAVLALCIKAQEIERKQDVDNLTGDELTRVVFQRRGTERKKATYATGYITVTQGNGIISVGNLFESEGGLQFVATETKDVVVGSKVAIECTTAGEVGNVPKGSITKMPVTLTGIISVVNDDATINGEDEESDDDLRQRYYEELREPATSGNKYHYKQWAKEVEGVGEANVISLWDGDNTVKVVIIDSDRQPASQDLVNVVQKYIDPNKSGTGEGEAPVGAYCTVVAAEPVLINVKINGVVNAENTTASMIKATLEQRLIDYLKQIAFKQSYVSVAQIGALIINTDGINDYDSYYVNNSSSRINLTDEQVAILGTVEVVLNE
ncbi:baseplate J/gp47 family protein [Veillonella sp.]|uniref:baseplate J/gp47 family protein n=1 Tax=Veillonella sp. TaxID=1926307 RepID=UPI0025F95942|nr:baseplate J/gp47 family protein [Veillonella sp.]